MLQTLPGEAKFVHQIFLFYPNGNTAHLEASKSTGIHPLSRRIRHPRQAGRIQTGVNAAWGGIDGGGGWWWMCGFCNCQKGMRFSYPCRLRLKDNTSAIRGGSEYCSFQKGRSDFTNPSQYSTGILPHPPLRSESPHRGERVFRFDEPSSVNRT